LAKCEARLFLKNDFRPFLHREVETIAFDTEAVVGYQVLGLSVRPAQIRRKMVLGGVDVQCDQAKQKQFVWNYLSA
jgi:hypothetical protein